MDWLSLENLIRRILRYYDKDEVDAEISLELIDVVLGDITGRGYEITNELSRSAFGKLDTILEEIMG